jgi:tRNA dimethylallyltransferase
LHNTSMFLSISFAMSQKTYDLISIVGPTACGKTTLAVALADRLGGEILSADSRQVYRGMDIGTGKDLSEYQLNGRQIPYHLIDIVDAGVRFNVFEYQQAFFKAYGEIATRGNQAIVCGGSGMYIEAAVEGYDLKPVPQNEELRASLEPYSLEELTDMLSAMKSLHNKTDVDTQKRAIRAIEIETYYRDHPQEKVDNPKLSNIYFGIDIPRELRRQRITQRLHQRLEEGLIDEVKNLLAKGTTIDDLLYYGLEYKFVGNYLDGQLAYPDMVSGLEMAIHQFAKRQMTWFRGMERKGATICWIDYHLPLDEKVSYILEKTVQ